MNKNIKQYDVVKIIKINNLNNFTIDSFNKKVPKIGDIATIVEIYNNPSLGYELECTNGNGTNYLHSFFDSDIELEVLKNLKDKNR